MVAKDIPAHALKVGQYLQQKLEALKAKFEGAIVDVRGRGLLLALQFRDTISATLISTCNEKGLLLNPVRPDAIRFMPPLIITEAEVDEAITKLEAGLTEVLAK